MEIAPYSVKVQGAVFYGLTTLSVNKIKASNATMNVLNCICRGDEMIRSITFSEIDNPKQTYTVNITELLNRTVKPVKKLLSEINNPNQR